VAESSLNQGSVLSEINEPGNISKIQRLAGACAVVTPLLFDL
jgi:hypothetical protein